MNRLHFYSCLALLDSAESILRNACVPHLHPRRLILALAIFGSTVMNSSAIAEIIYESGNLGPTGLPKGTVPAANVNSVVFNGVRFRLTDSVFTTQLGGHFVGFPNTTDTLFGALVKLVDENDFPDSGDLSTPDVLGSTKLAFPAPSAEVFGDLSLRLDPGWYALVFGSGLFNAAGDGAMPLNNSDIGNPTYIGFQPGAGWGELINPIFRNYRFVMKGQVIPEPNSIAFAILALFLCVSMRLSRP